MGPGRNGTSVPGPGDPIGTVLAYLPPFSKDHATPLARLLPPGPLGTLIAYLPRAHVGTPLACMIRMYHDDTTVRSVGLARPLPT